MVNNCHFKENYGWEKVTIVTSTGYLFMYKKSCFASRNQERICNIFFIGYNHNNRYDNQ